MTTASAWQAGAGVTPPPAGGQLRGEMTAPLTINLPMPPSVNGAYANVPKIGRVKTAAYKAWLIEAGWKGKIQLSGRLGIPFLGPVSVSVELNRPRANADLDNRFKCLADLLTGIGVWKDDRQVHEIRMRWADVEGCVVTISEMG